MRSRRLVATIALLLSVARALLAFPPEFLRALEQLPSMPMGVHSYLFSSFDRTGANDDGNRLYAYSRFDRASGVFTLHETGGPGEVVRLWKTGWRDPESLRWIVDDEVALELPVASHFDGTTVPYLTPWTAGEYESSGGFVSYVPLSWSRSFALETRSVPRYFQLGYRRFASEEARTEWEARPVLPDRAEERVYPGASIAPRSAAPPVSISHTGWISAIRITIDTASVTALEESGAGLDRVRLHLDVDGSRVIDAPLSIVAGGARYGERVDAVPVRVSREESALSITLRFPIPVTGTASVRLVNESEAVSIGEAIVTMTVVADASVPQALSMGRIGRFFTVYREHRAHAGGEDLVVLDTVGRGVFVGLVLDVRGRAQDELRILEGDERIFLDRARTPQFHGTGTEDFFNGGWYYEHGSFTRPFSGHVHRSVDGRRDIVTQYRYLITDPIPFYSAIRFRQEYGPTNDVEGAVRSFAIWYATDRGVLEEIPIDRISGPGATGADLRTDQPLPVWGDPTVDPVAGALYQTDRSITLSAALPSGVRYLVLRRSTDARVVPQRASVRVNGGEPYMWVVSGHSRRPMLREVEIPLALPEEGSRVEITIQPDGDFVAGEWRLFGLSR